MSLALVVENTSSFHVSALALLESEVVILPHFNQKSTKRQS